MCLYNKYEVKEMGLNATEEYNRKYGEYLICKEDDYKCNRCKKIWEPTDADINKKVMMTYYKNCNSCRLYLFNKCIEYKKRDDILFRDAGR